MNAIRRTNAIVALLVVGCLLAILGPPLSAHGGEGKPPCATPADNAAIDELRPGTKRQIDKLLGEDGTRVDPESVRGEPFGNPKKYIRFEYTPCRVGYFFIVYKVPAESLYHPKTRVWHYRVYGERRYKEGIAQTSQSH